MSGPIEWSPPGDVSQAFYLDRSPVSLIEGPVGSGKTVTTLFKGLSISREQRAFRGVRYSRGVFIRNTYPELKSTVIKSFQDWFPESIAPIKWDAPITARLKFPLGDGTLMDCEILFLSFDSPQDIGKLKGWEGTWAALSEANELPKAALDMATQRVGRYPGKNLGGPSWYGVFGDTNMPDDDHYLYTIFEKDKPAGYKLFRQPGGLIEVNGQYLPNPAAENIENLPGGHEYYLRQLAGKSKEWIKVFLLAQYGTIADGRPVYPEWNDELHVRTLSPYPNLPLLLGFDYGLTPACAICQISPRGEFLVLAELCSKDMGIRQFANDVVKPFLAMNYHGFQVQACGDPAGMSRSDTDEKTCFQELAEAGIAAVPASSNSFIARREAVAGYLNRLVSGRPVFALDPSCDRLRRGFNGRYQYRRLQVVGAERFKDVPEKNEYSHCFPANTLITTPTGRKAIGRIMVGDFVTTPLGPRRVTATMNRDATNFALVEFGRAGVAEGRVWATPCHPFITSAGVVSADALQYGDVLISQHTAEEKQWADRQSTHRKNSTGSSTTGSARGITKPRSGITGAFATCIVMFGSFIAALFLTGLRFTIGITTRATTKFQTWKWWKAALTLPTTAGNALLRILPPPLNTCDEFGLLLPNGTHQRTVERGIAFTASALGKEESQRNTSAFNAGRNMKHWKERARRAIALLRVKVLRVERLAWMMSKGSALSALEYSPSTNTPRHEPAPRIVGVSLWEMPSAVKVYDLTVEDAHCFYAEGVLVHNCHDALQYAALYSQTMANSNEWSTQIKYPDRTGWV